MCSHAPRKSSDGKTGWHHAQRSSEIHTTLCKARLSISLDFIIRINSFFGLTGGATSKEKTLLALANYMERRRELLESPPLRPVFLPGESPWTEKPGGLWSMGSQRVGHDWRDLAHMHREQRSHLCPGAKKKKRKRTWRDTQVQTRQRQGGATVRQRLELLCHLPSSIKDGQQPPEDSPSVLQEEPAPPTPGLQTSSLPNKLLLLWSGILCYTALGNENTLEWRWLCIIQQVLWNAERSRPGAAGDTGLCLDMALVPSFHLQQVKAEKWWVQRVNTCDSGDTTLEVPGGSLLGNLSLRSVGWPTSSPASCDQTIKNEGVIAHTCLPSLELDLILGSYSGS